MKFNLSGISTFENMAKTLMHGLKKLTFLDNMESFEVENLTIPARKSVDIPNKLTSIPSKYIIVSQVGNGLVTKVSQDTGSEKRTSRIKIYGSSSNKPWTKDTLYLKNHGGEDVIVTVIFFI